MKEAVGFIKAHDSSPLSIKVSFILDDHDINNLTTFNDEMNPNSVQLWIEFI